MQGIKIQISPESINKVKEDFQKTLKQLKTNAENNPIEIKIKSGEIDQVVSSLQKLDEVMQGINSGKFTEQIEKGINKANEAIKKLNENVSGLDKNVFATFQDMNKHLSEMEGFKELQDQVDKVKKSFGEMGKITAQVDSETKKITSATISYMDKAGNEVKKYMKLLQEEGSKEIKLSLSHTDTDFSKNMQQSLRQLEDYQKQLDKLEKQINSKGINSDKLSQSLDEFKNKIQQLKSEAEKGNNINFDNKSKKKLDDQFGKINEDYSQFFQKSKNHYDQLFKNQEQIFKLKQKMLSADEESTKEIQKQIKELNSANGNINSGLTRSGTRNALLDNEYAKINTQNEKVLDNMQRLLDANNKDKLNIKDKANELKKQIELEKELEGLYTKKAKYETDRMNPKNGQETLAVLDKELEKVNKLIEANEVLLKDENLISKLDAKKNVINTNSDFKYAGYLDQMQNQEDSTKQKEQVDLQKNLVKLLKEKYDIESNLHTLKASDEKTLAEKRLAEIDKQLDKERQLLEVDKLKNDLAQKEAEFITKKNMEIAKNNDLSNEQKKKSLYEELIKYQQKLYDTELKLVGAEGEEKKALELKRDLYKGIVDSAKQAINTNNLQDAPDGKYTKQLGRMRVEHNVVDMPNAKALDEYNKAIQTEKELYKQLEDVEKQIVKTQGQLDLADDKEIEKKKQLTNVLTRLKQTRSEINAKIVDNKVENDEKEAKITGELQKILDDIAIKKAKMADLDREELAQLNKQLERYKQLKEIQLQTLEAKTKPNVYGNLDVQSAINSFKSNLNSATIDNFNPSELNAQYQALNATIQKVAQEMKILEAEELRLKKLGSEVNSPLNLQSSEAEIKAFIQGLYGLDVEFKKISGDSQVLAENMRKVDFEIKNADGSVRKMTMTIDGASKSTRMWDDGLKFTNKLQQGSKDAETFGSKLKNIVATMLMFQLGGDAIMASFMALKDGISVVKEMDDALTDLQKVTDLTSDKYERMVKSATKMGNELGKSDIDIMKGMAESGRIFKDEYKDKDGKKHETNDIEEFTKTAVMASNVTEMSVQEASKALTTAMQTFKKNATDTLKAVDARPILDQWNSIQNNFRTSATDLAQGIGAVGSVAKSSGTDIQHLEGYITALVHSSGITGDEAGTSIKTMMARMFKIGKDGEEDAGKSEELLNKLGISVRKNATEFRNYQDILEDVAKSWNGWSSARQKTVAQQLAGTNHYAKFISLMENYKVATDATTEALKSQGSAEKENATYLQSIEGRWEQTKNKARELAGKLIDSETIKWMVTGLGNILEKVGTLIDAFKNMNGVSKALVISFGALLLSGKPFLGFLTGLGTTSVKSAGALAKVTQALLRIIPVLQSLSSISAIFGALKGAVAGGIASLTAFGEALAGFIATPVGLAITAIVLALGALTYALFKSSADAEEHKKKVDELTEAYKRYKDAVDNADSAKLKVSTEDLGKAQKDIDGLADKLKKAEDALKKDPNAMTNRNFTNAQKELDNYVKALEEAGFHFDNVHKKILEFGEVQKNLKMEDVVKSVVDGKYALVDNKEHLINLIETYKSLTEEKNRGVQGDARMSNIAKELNGTFQDLILTKKADGNVTIENTNLLDDKIKIMQTENANTIINKQEMISSSLQKMQQEQQETDNLINEIETRINAYQKLLDAQNQYYNNLKTSGFGAGIWNSFVDFGKSLDSSIPKYQTQINQDKKTLDYLKKNRQKFNDDVTKAVNQNVQAHEKQNEELKKGAEYYSDIDDKTKKAKKSTEAMAYAVDNLANSLKMLDLEMTKIDSNMSKMSKYSDEYIGGFDKKAETLRKEIALLKAESSKNQMLSGSIGANAGLGGQIENFAEQYMNTAYQWGGSDPSTGFDCSGLVQYAFKQFGIALERSTSEQVKQGVHVGKDQLQAGDLVFFGSASDVHHVGIYAGNGQYLHSPKTGDVVKKSNLSDRNDFYEARRLVPQGADYISTNKSSNSGVKYENYINEASVKFDVDPALIKAVIERESSFNQNDVSNKGAIGLMQLMPSTAKELGVDPNDAYQNIMGGTKYLSQLMDMFDGDLQKVIAGYNAGEGAVQKYGGIPPYEETQNYVNNVLQSYSKYGGVAVGTKGGRPSKDANQNADRAFDGYVSSEKNIIAKEDELYKLLYSKFEAQIARIDYKANYWGQMIEGAKTLAKIYEDSPDRAIMEYNNAEKMLNQKIGFIQQEADLALANIQSGQFTGDNLDKLNAKYTEIRLNLYKAKDEYRQFQQEVKDFKFVQYVKPINDTIDKLNNQLELLNTKYQYAYEDKIAVTEKLIRKEQQLVDINQNMLVELQMQKTMVDKNSEAWTTLQQSVDKYTKSFTESLKKLAELNKQVFDEKLNASLKKITDGLKKPLQDIEDAKYRLEMLNSEVDESKGRLLIKDRVDATNVNIEKQKEYREDLIKVIQDLVYQRDKLKKNSEEWEEINDKVREYVVNLHDVNKEILDAQNSIEQLYESIGNQISDVQEHMKELLKKAVEQEKKSLDDSLKNYEDYIQAKIKLIDEETERENYADNLKSSDDKISKLKKEIAELRLDTSADAKSRVKELTEKLQEEQLNRDKMMNTHSKEQRKAELQSQIDAQRQLTEKTKQELDERYSDEKINAMVTKALWDGFFTDIDGLLTGTKGKVLDIKEAYTLLENKWGDGMTTMGDSIEKNWINKIQNAIELMKQYGQVIDGVVKIILPDISKDTGKDVDTGEGKGTSSKPSRKGVIYGSGQDLEHAKQKFGDRYDYKNITDSGFDWSKEKVDSDLDMLVGGDIVNPTNKYNDGMTRLGGTNSVETNQAIDAEANRQALDVTLDNIANLKDGQKIKVYGTGNDLEHARSTMDSKYFDFVDTSTIKDKNSYKFDSNGIILGGAGAEGGVPDIPNANGLLRLWGAGSGETNKAIDEFESKIKGIKGNGDKVPDTSKGKPIIYGKGADMENAKRYFSENQFDFKSLDGRSDADPNDYKDIRLKSSDYVVGGTGVIPSLQGETSSQRLAGLDRWESDAKMKKEALKYNSNLKFAYYNKNMSKDYLSAMKLRGLGYIVTPVDPSNQDTSKMYLTSNDAIIGGEGVMPMTNLNGAKRLSGATAELTAQAVDNFIKNKGVIDETTDIINQNPSNNNTSKVTHVYAKNIKEDDDDYHNARRILGETGYSYHDVATERVTSVDPNSIIIGGGILNDINTGVIPRLWGGYGTGRKETAEAIQRYKDMMVGIRGYSTGGTIDYTDIAMVHGSPNHNEVVFNSRQAKQLFDFVNDLPNSIFNIVPPNIANTVTPTQQSNEVKLQIDNLINIEGNATKDMLPSLEKIGEKIIEKIKTEFKMSGARW